MPKPQSNPIQKPSLNRSVFCFAPEPQAEVESEADKYCFKTNPVAIAVAEEGKTKRNFTGVAFSGEPITDHWFWDAVIFDLDTTNLPAKCGTLINHDDNRRCGVITSHSKDYETGLSVSGHLLRNAYGKEVAEDSEDDYPWQMSVRIYPGSIEEVQAGQSVSVNGKTHQGPITVFRNNRIREVSFCAVGADDKTYAKAFKAGNKTSQFKSTSEENDMDLAQAQARIGELEREVGTKDQRITDLETQNKQFAAAKREAEIAALATELGSEFSAEDAAEYAQLDDKAFAFTAKQLRAAQAKFASKQPAKPNLPAHMFTDQATNGQEQNQQTEKDQRRTKFAAEAQKLRGEKA